MLISLLFIVFVAKTWSDYTPPSKDFVSIKQTSGNLQVLDRNGSPLNISYQNRWNMGDTLPLYKMPDLLKKAFIAAEDKRFYEHSGVDWLARSSAMKSMIENQRAVRGASTITEQVVRLLHPRPRSIWSKWIETLEALELDSEINKSTILEFYLNQVPYASNRKGIVQASRYYFGRTPDTLNEHEMLALAVLVRSPTRLDLYKNRKSIDRQVKELAVKLGIEPPQDELQLGRSSIPANAQGFVEFIKLDPETAPFISAGRVRTTLDSNIQSKTYELLKGRLKALASRKVENGAALVVDHTSGEIIAWVVAGNGCEESNFEKSGCKINMVRSARQPGSSMKPLLYAAALDKGWNAATIIQDEPYSEAVGRGIHNFRNYSSVYYGDITLRQALGNSLNIPALKTINYVGAESYLKKLHQLGFKSLDKEADFYDEGLALGNGEVTLYELVRGFAALANKGHYRKLKAVQQQNTEEGAPIYTEETVSIIGNILSDPWARLLEFGGANSVLNLPVQTAVKTGTSNDHRDAWVVGYNHKYVVGVWMGNISREPTKEVTGSTGPALVMRGIFKELNFGKETQPLYLSPKLVQQDICVESKGGCIKRTEYFAKDHMPEAEKKTEPEIFRIVRPTNNLEMAYDPRIPASHQYFEFSVSGLKGAPVQFYLNGQLIYESTNNKYLWQVKRGKYSLKAVAGGKSDSVNFVVK